MKSVVLLLFALISVPVFSQWTVFTQTSTQGLANGMVSSIIQAGDKIWFSTEKGVYAYDNFSGNWSSYNVNNGIGANFVNKVRPYTQNYVMAATNGGGLSIQNSTSWTTYNTSNGLESQMVYDARLYGSELWVATYGGGVGYRYQGIWKFFNVDSGLVTNNFTCVFKDDWDRMWFGTFDAGVYMLENNVWTHISVSDGLSSNFVSDINSDNQGRIWFATNQGVSVWENGSIDVLNASYGLTNGMVYQIYRDLNYHMYLATDEGVYEWFNGPISHLTAADGLKSNKVISVLKSSWGDWYYGHNGEGLSVFTAGSWLYFDAQTGLKSNYISDGVCLSDGTVWVATSNGVSRYSGKQWKTWNTDFGLPYKVFTHVVNDSFGYIYLKPSYTAALLKFDGIEDSVITGIPSLEKDVEIGSDDVIWASAQGQVYSYNGVQSDVFNGFAGLSYYNGDVACGPNGTVYVMNGDGLYCYNNGSWSVLNYPGSYADPYSNANNNIICVDENGKLYLYSYLQMQIFSYDSGIWANISQGLYWKYLSSMITDSNGVLIVTGIDNSNYYITRIYTFNGVWKQFDTPGFGISNLNQLFTDINNNLWICTGQGVAFAPMGELGVSETASASNISVQVYPNPASDFVQIVSDLKAEADVTISIYSNIGSLMQRNIVSSDEWNQGSVQLSVSNLIQGVYLLQMNVDGVSVNSTIVKQ